MANNLKLPKLPPRPTDGHKGTFGHVLIVAGSRGMSGAACLCGLAALRTGSGLVSVAIPESIASIVASFNPCYLTIPLPEDNTGKLASESKDFLVQQAQSRNAVAIGPGLGQSEATKSVLLTMIAQINASLVLDADALNLIQNYLDVLNRPSPTVLTPHPGELSRLTKLSIEEIQQDRETIALDFAKKHRIILLLKGAETVITDGEKLTVNLTGNAGMATGGTGDVLTGMIVSLIGQGMDAFEAAHLGAHLHGLAGDFARDALGERAMIALDLLDYLPQAMMN